MRRVRLAVRRTIKNLDIDVNEDEVIAELEKQVEWIEVDDCLQELLRRGEVTPEVDSATGELVWKIATNDLAVVA